MCSCNQRPQGATRNDKCFGLFEPRFEAAVPQGQIDEYLARQAGYDPDIWVLEVEDRNGRAFLR